jgi:hypothetical protein
MSESVVIEPRPLPQHAEKRRGSERKMQPGQFPYRVTLSMAEDEIQALAQAKKMFRASEAFCLRLAWDNFARANNLFPLNNGGPNVR